MALDMKSLKSKLGGAGKGAAGVEDIGAEKKPNPFMEFLNKNPAMKIAVPVLLVVLVVGVIALILLKTGSGGTSTTTTPVPPGGSVVAVLPQQGDLEVQQTMPTGDARDPFLESNYLSGAKVTAIIKGFSANIVFNGGSEMQYHLNEYIQSSSWQVVSITADSVTLECKTISSGDTTSVSGEIPSTSQQTRQIVLKLAQSGK
ncbi:MAG: hypothetical protein GX051_07040 [Clostridiales bacterium]|jgi:hypothetical protein|nr:hypothetical protein [Clostridiales bacterium]